jgi:hypothetical protein
MSGSFRVASRTTGLGFRVGFRVAGATITQAKKKGPPSEGGRRTIREQKERT